LNGSHAAKHEIQAAQYRTAYHWDTGKAVEFYRYGQITAMMVEQITSRSYGSKIHVLDVGCGDGRATFLVWSALRAAGHTCRVTGRDISEDAIHWARERTYDSVDETLQFSVGGVEDGIDRLNATGDQPFLIMRELLEHLPDDQVDQALRAIAARCPTAILCVSVPSSNSPVEEKHFRHYDEQSLRDTFGVSS
jgi:2-polyprenyl-3-methyl-5-hydroxy-6-metoxy-1,4-benzoquinol methylase